MDDQPHVVLVVEDDETVRRLFTFTLESAGLRVLDAPDGDRALALLERHRVDVVLLDRSMPGRDGHATLEAIRADPRTAATSVIFVTGSMELDDRLRGLDAGADDYLEKPIAPAELVARVKAHLRGRAAWRRALDHRLQARTSVAQALGRIPVDTPPRAAAEAICHRLDRVEPATSSALVLLPEVGEAEVLAGTGSFAMAPRRLPRPAADRLRRCARGGAWIEQRSAQPPGALSIPLGGPDIAAAAYVPLTADEEPFGLLVLTDGRARAHGDADRCLSAGIDLAPLVAALLRPLFGGGGQHESRRAALRRRITERAFRPAFQPVVDLSTSRVVGFEALTRFDDGASPERVFLEATALGLGPDLEAASAAAALQAAERLPESAWISLNVSPAFLTDTDRLGAVLAHVRRPTVLELTEHDRIDDYERVRGAVAALEREPRLSVDDAGSGYACLHHVLELRPAFVKLDRGWIKGIDTDPARQALVAGLGDFAERTGGRLIAEGIEQPEELATLGDLGVPLGQGWLLGRPADATSGRS